MSDKSRDRFRAWFGRLWGFPPWSLTDDQDDVRDADITWDAWQASNTEINNLKKFKHIIHEADGELSAIAHGRSPSDKDELLRLSNELRKLAKILDNI